MKNKKARSSHTSLTNHEETLHFPQLPDAFLDPILVTTATGNVYYVNPAWEKLTGYTLQEVKGKNPRFLHSPKTPKKIFTQLWKALAEGKAFSSDEIIDRAKDGREYSIYSTFFPIRKNKTIVFYVQYLQDITKNKIYITNLKESEKKYKDLMNLAPDGIFIADLSGKYIDVNESGAKMLGYLRKEIIGKNIQELIPPEDIARLWKAQKYLLKGNAHVGEWQLKKKDGSLLPVEVSAKVLPDGRWQGFARDITARKQAEEAIMALNKRISEIFNRISDGFYSLDKRWCFTHFNTAAEKLLPYKAEQLLGRNIWKMFPGLIGTDMEMNFKKAMIEQKSITFKRTGLMGRVYQIHCYPSSSGLSVYFEDITLQEEVSKRQLEFISIASHELKTPLTNISLYTELLDKEAKNLQNQKLTNIANKLTAQIETLRELTQDIFDTSSIQTGQLRLKKDVTSLNTLIKNSIKTNQPLALQHKIILKGKTKHRILIDKIRITQVLNNLIANAIKYSPSTKKIMIHVNDEKDNVIVGVQDFGIGIPKEKQRLIFNKYYRTMEGKDVATGLGLGLYISYNIMKAHGGDMWVESEEGKGSTFSFRLPVPSSKNIIPNQASLLPNK